MDTSKLNAKATIFWIATWLSSIYGGVYAQTNNILTDPRDGKLYKTIQIGNQIWMAENLNFENDRSWCKECDIYGRMYNFEGAKAACPPGWHLPTQEEWEELIQQLGGARIAGDKMKSLTRWKTPDSIAPENFGATNEIAFAGIPAHYRTNDGKIQDADHRTTWWSASEGSYPAVWTWSLYSDRAAVECMGYTTTSGFSVRCVKNFMESPTDVSQDEAVAFLRSFDKFPELNTMILIYLNQAATAYNALLHNPVTKPDYNKLFSIYMSAYAVDTTIVQEVILLSEVDSGLNLKQKYLAYYQAELKTIKAFNSFFDAIARNKPAEDIELLRKNLVAAIVDMKKHEKMAKSAEMYFKEKYKIE